MSIPQIRTPILFAITAVLFGFLHSASAQDSRHVAPPKPDAILSDSKTAAAGAIYINEDIGLSFPIPDSWIILGDTFRTNVRTKSKELYKDNPERQRNEVVEAIERTTVPFAMMEPVSPNRRSSNLMLMTENVPEGSILSLRTYFDASLATMKKSNQISVEVLEPLTPKKIGNKLCGFFKLRVETAEFTFSQRYLLFIRGRTAVVLLFNYYDQSGDEVFDKIVASVKID